MGEYKTHDIKIENKLRPLENKLMQYEQVCGKLIIKDGVGIGLLPDGEETVYVLKSIAKVTRELAIRRTKQEIAREIFEEIERYILGNCCVTDDDVDMIWKHIAELKKKYTEEAK